MHNNEEKFRTFPANRIEALALLYVQSQDLTGISPADIQSMYYEAYHELEDDYTYKIANGIITDQNR